MNAFILVACATFNASLALGEPLTLDWQPTAMTYQISYGVCALLIVAMILMLGERLFIGYRRKRACGKSSHAPESPVRPRPRP